MTEPIVCNVVDGDGGDVDDDDERVCPRVETKNPKTNEFSV